MFFLQAGINLSNPGEGKAVLFLIKGEKGYLKKEKMGMNDWSIVLSD